MGMDEASELQATGNGENVALGKHLALFSTSFNESEAALLQWVVVTKRHILLLFYFFNYFYKLQIRILCEISNF